MVNSLGINVDVIKYFCCISIITQPLECCQHYMKNSANQMWTVCSEITAVTFWHEEATSPTAMVYLTPWGARGAVPWPGAGCKEHSGRLRYSCSPQIWSCFSQDGGRKRTALGCCKLTGLQLKSSKAILSGPYRGLLFSLSFLRCPKAHSCFQSCALRCCFSFFLFHVSLLSKWKHHREHVSTTYCL